MSFKHTVPQLWKQIDCLSMATSFSSFVGWFNSLWVEMLFSVPRNDNSGGEFQWKEENKIKNRRTAVLLWLDHSLKQLYDISFDTF